MRENSGQQKPRLEKLASERGITEFQMIGRRHLTGPRGPPSGTPHPERPSMALKDAETGGKAPGKTSKRVLTELQGASGHNVRSQLPPALLKADAVTIAITGEKDGKLRVRTSSCVFATFRKDRDNSRRSSRF